MRQQRKRRVSKLMRPWALALESGEAGYQKSLRVAAGVNSGDQSNDDENG